MPATDSATLTKIRRSSLSQVHAMGSSNNVSASHERELESFQRQVANRFHDLSSVPSDELLSLSWIQKLLDVFLCCQEEFRLIILNNKAQVTKPPLDRLVSDFYERSVKALDVCNAIRDGIEQIKQWQKLLEIVLCALGDSNVNVNENCFKRTNLGEGQFRRARKALADLAIMLLDEKDSGQGLSHRNRSFGRNNIGSSHHRSSGHFRSLSWSVSRSWSAAKQLQAIGNNLVVPRGNEVVATNGLAMPVYTMGCVLLFVMWALVAAIPCQDRGLQVNFNLPRQFQWAAPILLLHDRIMEESKKRDRKSICGLLREIYQVEKCSRLLGELADSVQFPLSDEKEVDARQRVKELRHICDSMKEGLEPLEKQVLLKADTNRFCNHPYKRTREDRSTASEKERGVEFVDVNYPVVVEFEFHHPSALHQVQVPSKVPQHLLHSRDLLIVRKLCLLLDNPRSSATRGSIISDSATFFSLICSGFSKT